MSPDPLSPGSSLQEGRFIIVGVIARGGQAVTFEAVDKQRGNRVAIKRFQVSGATSWKDVELAEREARVLSALNHPNLPQYVAHFEEAGSLYLVMDFVAGPTLEELRSSNALRHSDVVHFLREMAVTLDYLHHHSPPIIHRDIKPRNVIRRPDGHFTLVDFGSVRDKLRPEGGSTVVGTFGYMAPEQFQGRAMPATDVYATAATALAMLTGLEPDQLPHQGLRLDVNAALSEDISPRLKRFLHQALEPDPDLRGGQSLTQLLKTYRLHSDDQRGDDNAAPHAGPTRRGRTATRPRAGEQHHPHVTSDGPPFFTHGHRRNRSRERRASETTVPNLETSVAQALEHQGVRVALRMPLVMTVVILMLLLVRTGLWLVLGVALPTLFTVLHAILRLPLSDAAGESMATARALRAQFRRVSKQLREVRRGTYVPSAPSTPAKQHTRYRVHTRPDSNVAPKAQSKPEQFADELEQDAERFESELERNVLSWQGRLSDRK